MDKRCSDKFAPKTPTAHLDCSSTPQGAVLPTLGTSDLKLPDFWSLETSSNLLWHPNSEPQFKPGFKHLWGGNKLLLPRCLPLGSTVNWTLIQSLQILEVFRHIVQGFGRAFVMISEYGIRECTQSSKAFLRLLKARNLLPCYHFFLNITLLYNMEQS